MLSTFWKLLSLSAPLFALVGAGYAIARMARVPRRWVDALNALCFTVLIPVLLFRLMAGIGHLPPVDARLLLAYFGACLVVFGLGRLVAARLYTLDGVGQSIFALGGVFSNNVLLGVPMARLLLGEAAMPAVALVLVFNALLLWTLVSVSVEWARHGALSLHGFGKTALGVLRNPIVAAIVLGAAYGLGIGDLPHSVDALLAPVADAAGPVVLVALGLGLAQYPVRDAWRESVAITVLKLVALPLAVLLLARALALPPTETRAVVLLASMAVGANVYLMARHFDRLHSAVASSLVLSTAVAAVTTPLWLALVGG